MCQNGSATIRAAGAGFDLLVSSSDHPEMAVERIEQLDIRALNDDMATFAELWHRVSVETLG